MPQWLTWQAMRLFFSGIWTKAAPLLARYWREVLIALLVLLIWHKDAQLAACQAFKTELKAAQPKAAASQAAVNHEPAAKSQAIAEKSDAQAPAYYRAMHAAADAHRVRPQAGSVAGRADLPGAAAPVTGLLQPSPAPDMVCRPRAEDDQLTGAAAWGYKMYLEIQALKEAGLVVPADPSPAAPK